MNKIIPIFGMMSSNLFFTISAIMGYSYGGRSESKIYIIYCFLIAILNVVITARLILLFKSNVNYKTIIVILSPLIIIFMYLLTILIEGIGSKLQFDFFKYALLWMIPAIYAGLYVSKKEIFLEIIKWVEITMIIFALSIISTVIIPFLRGNNFESIGGATYQSASYISAFSYGLNLYFIIISDKQYRFKFTNSIIYKIIALILIPIQLVGVFITGGRGGIVLCSVYTIYIFMEVMKTKRAFKIVKSIVIILTLIIIIYSLLPELMKNEIFNKGFSRTFDFLNGTGINWDGTSGRNEVYSKAINLIVKSPVIGYGLYGFIELFSDMPGGYPHNMILEILLNGGIIYLACWLIFIVIIIKRGLRLIKYNPCFKILIIMFLYPMTMLMFSGSYMRCSELWFLISVILLYPIKKEGVLNEKSSILSK